MLCCLGLWFDLLCCLFRFGLAAYVAGWVVVCCWIVDIMFDLGWWGDTVFTVCLDLVCGFCLCVVV